MAQAETEAERAFYSADQLSEEMKRLLIEQHTFTNTVIASAFWKIR